MEADEDDMSSWRSAAVITRLGVRRECSLRYGMGSVSMVVAYLELSLCLMGWMVG